MRNFLIGLVATAALLPGVATGAPLAQPSLPLLEDNPWTERRVLNIAHRGGASEFPENTLFAYHKALEAGADVLEADVYPTADGELVVIHDETVDRTTDGSGSIRDLTLTEVKALDAAHWYVPGRGATRNAEPEEYAYRGVATGEKQPPKIDESDEDPDAPRYPASFFTIPTLEEFLAEFPDEFMVIELKPSPDESGSYEMAMAETLQGFGRADDVTVASFLDNHLELFKAFAPEIHTSLATAQAGAFWAKSQDALPGSPSRHHALQVPIVFNGLTVVTEDFVADAHANDLAVHVWTVNDRADMEWLLSIGVDGIMTDRPSLLEEVITEADLNYTPPN